MMINLLQNVGLSRDHVNDTHGLTLHIRIINSKHHIKFEYNNKYLKKKSEKTSWNTLDHCLDYRDNSFLFCIDAIAFDLNLIIAEDK